MSEQYDFLDCLAIVSFMISLANYDENISQSQMDDTVKAAVQKVNAHLEMQDKKIDEILRRLEK